MPTPPHFQLRSLVGRDQLLDASRRLLGQSARLVTLTGPGGVGKTRIAQALFRDWSGPARFIPLGTVRHADQVADAVAQALGLRGVRDADTAVLEALDTGLVVLDELEHLAQVERVLTRWIQACPDVYWLATSRHALGVPAEVEVVVPPLAIPRASELQDSPAAALFLDAAGRDTVGDDADAIAAILALTGGLPLAIELAAGRLAVLQLSALRSRLGTAYFETLRDPMAPERALQAVLDDTCQALAPEARQALAECTVFAGALTVEGAEAVLSVGAGALDALHALTRWHLVSARDGRIEMLEPVRRFARARLDPTAEQQVMGRHAAWVAGLAEGLVARHRHEPAVVGDIERLAIDLRAVLERASQGLVDPAAGLSAGRALCVLYDVRGPTDTLLACTAAVIALDPGTSAAAQETWSDVAARRVRRLAAEDDPSAAVEARAAIDAADRFGAVRGRARSRAALGVVHHRFREFAPARAALDEALGLLADDDPAVRAALLCDLALVVHDQMAYPEADVLVQDALRIAQAEQDRFVEAQAYGLAATMQVERGDFPAAEHWNQLTLQAWANLGDSRQHALAVLRGGTIAEGMNDLDLSARRYAEGETVLLRVQARSLAAWARGALGRIALVRGDLGRAEEMLPGWQHAGKNTEEYYHVFAAALAAFHGDVPAARAHVAEVHGEPLARVLLETALIAADGFAAEPASEAARQIALRARSAWSAHLPGQAPLIAQVGDALLRALDQHAGGWLVASDGSWFRPPGGERADLSRRRAPARILQALATARSNGGEALDVGALFEAGWPGEHIVAQAASNRVYVALATLRDAGLAPLLVRDGHGWRLDPAVPLHVTPP